MMGTMRDPVIVPSARNLAEENNVDWRVLEGSGEGGSVVEQDVLSFLARVMQGDEVTNPTPEPVPEGMTAWPEEAHRRPDPSAKDLFTASFKPAAPPPPTPEPRSPWLTGSAKPEPVAPQTDGPAFGAFSAEPARRAESEPQAAAATFTPEPPAAFPFAPSAASQPAPGVSETEHRAVLDELKALKDRLAGLEDERRRHVGELEQLGRLQETIAQQRSETAKLAPLQSELQTLKAQLEGAQQGAGRAAALEEQNRDLTDRLERARVFKEEAKLEFDRLMALNASLEGQLAAPKRPWWQFWG